MPRSRVFSPAATTTPGHAVMVWFFEKDGIYVRVESRIRPDPPRYELVWTDGDGVDNIELFETEGELLRRYDVLTVDLRQSGWTGPSTWRI